jgi:hypothetical protein
MMNDTEMSEEEAKLAEECEKLGYSYPAFRRFALAFISLLQKDIKSTPNQRTIKQREKQAEK